MPEGSNGVISAAFGVDPQAMFPPVSAAAPAGEPLDDQVFILEQKARPQAQIIEGSVDERNWRTILSEAHGLLAHTRHLQVAVLQAQALAQVHGWAGFLAGVGAIQVLLAQHWEHLYPSLDEDGDPYRRVNALAALANPELVSALRRAPILSGLATTALMADEVDEAQLRSALLAASSYERSVPRLLLETLKAIARLMEGHGAAVYELDPLVEIVEQVGQRLRSLSAKYVEEAPMQEEESEEAVAEETASPAASRSVGEIRCGDDVLRALDRICSYYDKYERSSPVPLLLERAKRLVNSSFLEAVADLADSGVPQVQLIMGEQPTKSRK